MNINRKKMAKKTYLRNFIQVVLKDPQRKSFLRIFWEFTWLSLRIKRPACHYFSRFLYRKGRNNLTDYYPNHILYSINQRINNLSQQQFVSNKLLYQWYFGMNQIPLPQLLAWNLNGVFFLNHQPHHITNQNEFLQFLIKVGEHAKCDSIFIKKATNSWGGSNTFKITSKSIQENPAFLKKLYNLIINDFYLFQESIPQHPKLNQLNPHCINSLRIDCFISQKGKAEIVSAKLRLGVGQSHVDNVSSGGMQIGIEKTTGKLKETAFSSITKAAGKSYTHHPTSGIKFHGFTIPHFHEARNLVQRAAILVPSLRLLGWDVAITPSGPLLIEGNTGYDITGSELAFGGYRKNQVFLKVMNELQIL